MPKEGELGYNRPKPGMVKRQGDAMKKAEKGKYGYNRPKPAPPKQGGKKK